jgi:hypothetical protein
MKAAERSNHRRLFHPIARAATALLLFIVPAGCADRSTHRINTQTDAERHLLDSALYDRIQARVDDPSKVQAILESTDAFGFDFWVHEDRPTHATTLERVRVDRHGRLYTLEPVNGEWLALD